jgi:hypothetical protein
MRELRDRARFPVEALAELWVAREARRQNLDRDGSIEPRVARFVDLTHAARADKGDDFVRTEPGAGS